MKFKYNDRVKAISGFYKGQKGRVISYWSLFYFFDREYQVRIDDFVYRTIKEKDMELTK